MVASENMFLVSWTWYLKSAFLESWLQCSKIKGHGEKKCMQTETTPVSKGRSPQGHNSRSFDEMETLLSELPIEITFVTRTLSIFWSVTNNQTVGDWTRPISLLKEILPRPHAVHYQQLDSRPGLWQVSVSANATDAVYEMVPGLNDSEMLTFSLWWSMWTFRVGPPNQLIYGADHYLFCCRALFGWASIIIIRQKRIFLVAAPLCATVCVCVFPVVFECERKVCSCMFY